MSSTKYWFENYTLYISIQCELNINFYKKTPLTNHISQILFVAFYTNDFLFYDIHLARFVRLYQKFYKNPEFVRDSFLYKGSL